MKLKFNPYCLSLYLAFRYVPKPNVSWSKQKKIIPSLPKFEEAKKIRIKNSQDIITNLKKITKKYQNKKVGILLSSGIDSAIVAYFLPKQTQAYTIKFVAPKAIDESQHASKIAKYLGIKHKTVLVSWKDYQLAKDKLMLHKKSPLHPSETAIYYAALQAKKDGIYDLFVGGGADALFGGMDKLLSKDWEYQEFINRYNFLNPKKILKTPADITNIYKKYKLGNSINVIEFLKVVFGLGTIQMFENAIYAASCNIIAPYEDFVLGIPLDIKRIRNGEPKYLLKEVYKKLYPSIKPLDKIPFARPMDQWFKNWKDLHRPEFRKDIDLGSLTGDQKWLVYSLQEFMDLYDKVI